LYTYPISWLINQLPSQMQGGGCRIQQSLYPLVN
jgi:hypothetical protein